MVYIPHQKVHIHSKRLLVGGQSAEGDDDTRTTRHDTERMLNQRNHQLL